MNSGRRKKHILPGFGLSLGITVLYLSLIVVLPLSMILLKLSGEPISTIWHAVSSTRVLKAIQLSFGLSFIAALVNLVFGLMLAWVLARYRFPGRKIVDALIDLPFALPTAVAGISLTTIYSPNGWIGQFFDRFGWRVAFTPIGILVALVFVGLPFVVRSVQPVLEDFDAEIEEASMSMGAGGLRTFYSVIFPSLWPSLVGGFSLAFARGLGEYGSVVFISGNMPMKTEIVPLLIMTKLEQFDLVGASALAMIMLLASFAIMFATNVFQTKLSDRLGNRVAG